MILIVVLYISIKYLKSYSNNGLWVGTTILGLQVEYNVNTGNLS